MNRFEASILALGSVSALVAGGPAASPADVTPFLAAAAPQPAGDRPLLVARWLPADSGRGLVRVWIEQPRAALS